MFNERGQRTGGGTVAHHEDQLFDGGFMELLGCEGVVFEKRVQETRIEVEEGFLFSPPYSSLSSSSSSSSSSSPSSAGFYPQMLHFGGGHEDFLPFNCDSSLSAAAPSSSSCGAATGRSRARSTKKVEGDGGEGKKAAASATPITVASNRKHKARSAGTTKVRKEKLGERISVLQQLVSPFGKTDTATVLHEAIGYIRFLHGQVQVLSSPYLQQLPLSSHQTEEQGKESRGGGLRSRGLCLVPVSCTENVANNNNTGADLWAAATLGGSNSFSSGSKH